MATDRPRDHDFAAEARKRCEARHYIKAIARAGYYSRMFSYRHAFHAGNHADVLKHTVLIAVLRHMTQKDAPMAVFDTHAGAGLYRLDPYHASLVFKVDHLGFSFYTASFFDFDATLAIDPAKPEDATLNATVEVASLTLPRPPDGFLAQLLGAEWLDAGRFPRMTFRSTAIERTGESTARVMGELTFRGQSRPVTFTATFNGGYPGLPGLDPQARIGFSAQGVLRRSDFGLSIGVPPEGSSMGVGDAVTFTIEAEFNGPPLADSQTPAR